MLSNFGKRRLAIVKGGDIKTSQLQPLSGRLANDRVVLDQRY